MAKIAEEPIANMEETTKTTTTRDKVVTRSPKASAAGTKPEDWSIELPHNFALDLDGLVAQFGKETVYANAFAQLIVSFQAAVRRLAENGKSDEEITTIMSTWKPGDKLGVGGDPIQKTLASFGNLSPEQKADLLQKLQALAS